MNKTKVDVKTNICIAQILIILVRFQLILDRNKKCNSINTQKKSETFVSDFSIFLNTSYPSVPGSVGSVGISGVSVVSAGVTFLYSSKAPLCVP